MPKNEVIISTGKHCIAPKTLTERYEELEAKLKVCEEHKNQFLEQRDSARKLAYSLAEHVKALGRGEYQSYPVDLVAQVDLARGVAGRYQWPEGEKSMLPTDLSNQQFSMEKQTREAHNYKM